MPGLGWVWGVTESTSVCDQEDVPCTGGVQAGEHRGAWGARG